MYLSDSNLVQIQQLALVEYGLVIDSNSASRQISCLSGRLETMETLKVHEIILILRLKSEDADL